MMTERSRPGAFAGVAATGAYDYRRCQAVPVAALLPLPVATLVHWDHGFRQQPVGVAVPRFANGVIEVGAVFRSRSCGPWALTSVGSGLSLRASVAGFDGNDVVHGTLVAVDLVSVPADTGARVRSMTTFEELSPEQLECQRRLDAYLSDLTNPQGFELFEASERDGVFALDVLAPVVAPILNQQGALI